MSEQTVQNIIRKAVADESFRALLLSNPAEALAGFDLTKDEYRNLSTLDPSLFTGEINDLGDRLSRGTDMQ